MTDRAAAWVVLGGALLFFLPGFADPYQGPRLLLPAVGAALMLIQKRSGDTLLALPATAFLGAACLSAVFGADGWYSVFGSYMFPADSLIAYWVYFAVLLAAARSSLTVDDVCSVVARASIPMSVYAVFQRFFHDPLAPTGLEMFSGRVVSTQGGPVFLGACLAVSAVCAAHLCRRTGERAAWAALALCAAAMWFNQTRGAWLAAAAGAAVMLPRRWAMTAIAAAVVGAAPRLLSAKSDIARAEVWQVAVRVAQDHPFLGYGPGNFLMAFRKYVGWDYVQIMESATVVQAHAHNELLHVLATMGLLGVAALLLLGLCLLWSAWWRGRLDVLKAMLACYAVLAAFNPVAAPVYIVLAAAFGAATRVELGPARRGWFSSAACAAAALAVGNWCWANWHFAQGARAHNAGDAYRAAVEFNRAAQIHPWESIYTCRQVDSMYSLLPAAAPGQAKNMAGAGLEIARRATRVHPRDSYAHELFGKTIIVAHQLGLPVEPSAALGEFVLAQELAPTFELLMWRRRAVARHLGDQQELARVEADLAALRAALAGRRRG